MKNIAIVGSGGFGREVKMLIDYINLEQPTYKILGFYDDKNDINLINNLPYLGTIDDINLIKENTCLAIAIGDPKAKKAIIDRINNNKIEYPNLIHPNVIMGKDEVHLGKGNIICAGTIITVNITIDDFVILNLSCTVGHDTIIESYSSFMPSVNISGEVCIKEKVYVGTGAKIINQLEIGGELRL